MLDRLEGGEDEEDRRAKSLVEEELGLFSSETFECVLIDFFRTGSQNYRGTKQRNQTEERKEIRI